MERSDGKLPPSLADNQLISLRQLAQVMNLSEVQTRRLVKAGKTPPPVRISARKLGFRTGAVRQFIDTKAGA